MVSESGRVWTEPITGSKESTHCMGKLLVLEALKVSVLVHAVHDDAALWFHPALGHQVQLRVHVYSLHLCVVVIIRGEAGSDGQRNELNQNLNARG